MHPGHAELIFAEQSRGDLVPDRNTIPLPEPVEVRVFPGLPEQAREVRRWVLARLAGRPVDSEAAALIADELFANALLHTASGDDDGRVTVAVTAASVIHVHDLGGEPVPAREFPLAGLAGPREGGQGRVLVTSLSSGCGLTPADQCGAGGPGDPAPAAHGGCAWALPLPDAPGPGGTDLPPQGPDQPEDNHSAAHPACGLTTITKGDT